MRLNLKALVDAALRFDARDDKKCSSDAGLTAAVRGALPDIERLRKEGVRWASIAAAFSDQGYTQGSDRRPLTASRLTAIYCQVVAPNKRSRKPRASREVQPPGAAPKIEAGRLRLAPELSTLVGASTPQTRDLEDSIRQARLTEIEQLIGEEIR